MALLWEIPGPFGSREQLEAAQAPEGGQLKNIVDLIVYTSFLFGVWRGGVLCLEISRAV